MRPRLPRRWGSITTASRMCARPRCSTTSASSISAVNFYKAARLTAEEYEAVQQHVAKGVEMLHPVGGSLRRIIPIILAHHDKFDGSGYNPTQGENIPLESRIIAVADVYDALTSDRPYRKAMSTYDARDVIVKGAGTGVRSSRCGRVRGDLPQRRPGALVGSSSAA